MKGKFDNFVGSRKKSSSNTTTKINNDIPILPDADENIDADLLYSVKPAELHSRVTESAYEDETMRPPINLPDIDLGLLFSNMTRKHHLEDVIFTTQVDVKRKLTLNKVQDSQESLDTFFL
ncbi:unnamed protein product [Aphis gossypii]|uniref:Uncharacterized protein n=1 Tax=Aphis gossypii TaxID=80765 RepID=A0A9P0J030_APHGO|nr:unnamed protein product [Aphis gossypii]